MTADLRERLQSSLAGTYTLERELSGGGMSRVFTATEIALGRSVVVKVLPPELAASVSTERFKREISVAARLQHPHIVPLLSAGEVEGVPYFTMPFVEGESLRVRLARHGEMPVSEGIRILREIASALAYAHGHGVVHRDIKPDNVLFAGDIAMVADFGVAKALVAAGGDERTGTVTSLGVALGTPAYMAPEQATADPTTDHRADIYAFGVLAYEMLTGQPPFSGRNPSQLLAAHVTEAPEAISRRRPSLPPALAALVMRCLEKRPADRPQKAGEVVHALDDITTPSGGMAPTSATLRPTTETLDGHAARHALPIRLDRRASIAVAVITALVLAGAGFAVWKRAGTEAGTAATDPRGDRIAVLPFENLGDSADAYFADGITDAVRGKLTGLPRMAVIARTSSMQYRGTTKAPSDIAKELGVRYLLTGTVRWAKGAGASHVQVSPELIEIADDGSASSRWQQPFDAEMADVFRVQGEIAGKVAQAMSVAVGGADQARLVEVPTRSPAAYDAFLRGDGIVSSGGSSPANIRRSIVEYEQAVRLDSGYAVAWARLARARALLYGNGVPTPELARQARNAAERALELAPTAAFAQSTLGVYFLNVERDAARALVEMEKATASTPNDPESQARLATVYMSLGRYGDAERSARLSHELDPRSVGTASTLCAVLLRLHRFPEARQMSDRVLALGAPNGARIQQRVMIALGEGDLAGARRVLHDFGARVNQDNLLAYMTVYGDLGWVLEDEAQRRVLTFGPELFDDDRAAWALARAQFYGWRGDASSARAWGDSAVRAFEQQVRVSPDDAQLHALLGLALAYAGRGAQAVAEGSRSTALLPIERDAVNGPYMHHVLSRIHVLLGEHEKALDVLEPLLARPYLLSPGWLRIDPSFAPLKGNPRFEKLIAGR